MKVGIKMENNKLVSIIIPCFNQAKYVADAINSALSQTYKNIQIVCVNDGSTDNSGEIIKSFADKYKNILFFDNKENKGVIYSRNLAIDACKGEYILPLDADDVIESSYVEKAVKILNENSNIGIVYSKAKFFGSKNEDWNLPKYNNDSILYANVIFASALFRKSDFLRAGKYKENMKDGFEDWDLWLSFIELGLKPYRIDEVLFYYRQYAASSRSKEVILNNCNVLSNILKNHIELYTQNEDFVKSAFMPSNNPKITKKLVKYKKLFNVLLIVCILQFFLIVLILYFSFFGVN